ncbi:MAG: hypothetical protein WC572_03645 [Candidatus Omnitrophota bacterium]
MDNKRPEKWYFKTWSLVLSFFCVGPFMLPLIWFHPLFSKKSKIIISVVVIVFTAVLAFFFIRSLKSLGDYYQFIENEIY